MTRTAQASPPPRSQREDAIGAPPQRPTLVPAQRYYSAGVRRASRSSGCGPGCGSSPAPSTTSPNPVTTSNTVAGHTRYRSFAATTVSCARFRTSAGTAVTPCAPGPARTCANCGAGITAGPGICRARCERVPHRKGFGALAMTEFPLHRGAGRHLGATRLRQSRRLRDAAARLPGGDPGRHRVEPAERLPLLRHHDHRRRRELEDDRRRVQRDLPHPDVASRAAPVHGRCLCAADHLGTHGQVRTALRRAQSAPQGERGRRRGVGRLREHPGRADGRRRGHPVPGRSATRGAGRPS